MRLKKTLFFALGPAGAAAIGFITLPILAWVFSPEDIGRAALLQIAVSLAFVVFGLALEQAYVREFYEYPDFARLLRTTAGPGLLVLLAITAVVILGGLSPSGLLLDQESSFLSSIIVACVYAHFLTTYSLLTLRMGERALAYSSITIASKGALFVLVLLCVVGGLDADLELLFGLYALSMTVGLVAALVATRREWLACLRADFDVAAFSGLLRFAVPLLVGGLAFWGLSSIDRLALRLWSSFEQLGYYSVALSFAGVAQLLQSIFTTIWTPTVYRWNVEGLNAARLQGVIDVAVIAVVFMYALVGVFSWLIGYLLPPGYALVEHVVVACIGGPLFYMLSETTVVGIHLQRRTGFAMLAPLLALLSVLGVHYLLVPRYGAAGAAVALNLSFLLHLLLRTEFSARLWQTFPRMRLYVFAVVCSTVSAAQALLKDAGRGYIYLVWILVAIAVLVCYKERLVQLKRLMAATWQTSKV